jgi:hypothetical protein
LIPHPINEHEAYLKALGDRTPSTQIQNQPNA